MTTKDQLPPLSPEEIEALREEHAAHFGDLAHRGLIIGADVEDERFARSIESAINAKWKEMLAAQALAQQAQEPITVEAVAEVVDCHDSEGVRLDWLVEGGLDSLPTGVVLLMSHRPITDNDGHGEVYIAPQPQPAAQATPEPLPADQAKWCEYVAGMVDCWINSHWPNYNHRDEERRVKAIAGIIERRLWALNKQPATPAPAAQPMTDELASNLTDGGQYA